MLDLDYSRNSVSDDGEYKRYSMRCNEPLALKPLKMPANLAKKVRVAAITSSGEEIELYNAENNYRHLIFADTDTGIVSLKAEFFGAWQSEQTNVYSFDLVPR